MNYKLILRPQRVRVRLGGPRPTRAMGTSYRSPNDVKDEAGYKNEFLTTRAESHRRPRRQYIAGGFNKTTTLNGAPPPNRVVIVQFESMAKVKDFATWKKAFDKIGEKYATLNTFAVEGAMPK